MFRHLHPTDSPRLLAFARVAGRAEAFTLSQAVQGTARSFSAVSYADVALSPRAWQSCWIKTDGARIQSIVRAGPRAGPLAWEVRELFLRRSHVHECADMLEELAVPAGRSEARRLFLRLPEGSPVFDQARRAGFAVASRETLYRAPAASEAKARLGVRPTPDIRPRGHGDDDALFRLYCATTPVGSRSGYGQTRSEWLDAAEHAGSRTRQWVVDGGTGNVTALLQTADLPASRCISAVWAADSRADLAALVASGLEGARPGMAAVALVPASNESLARLLEEIGFEAVQNYEVMAKVLAAPVMQTTRAMAAVG